MADQPSARSKRQIEALHAHHIATGGEEVPEDISQEVMQYLDDVATAVGRQELIEGIEVAYAAIGVWEDFLKGVEHG